MDKKEFRKRAKEILNALTDDQLRYKSKLVSDNLLTLLQNINSSHSFQNGLIGAYAPIQKEVIWYESFNDNYYDFAVPHIFGDAQMEYHQLELSIIKEKQIGIELEDHYRSQFCLPDIIFIPGLAFTIKGERLGRGKGYFDRFLSRFKGIKIGVAYSDQLMEEIPTDEHDELLDYLVTETEIYKINEG